VRRCEPEGARTLEAEARVVRRHAHDHHGALAQPFGACKDVFDQRRPNTAALAVGAHRHRRQHEDPVARGTHEADPAEHHVADEAGVVLGDERELGHVLA